MKGIEGCIIYLPEWMQADIKKIDPALRERVTEIHIRAGCEISLTFGAKTMCLSKFSGKVHVVDTREMDLMYRAFCNYSVHKFTAQNAGGYIPLPGGHRVGLAGRNIHFEERHSSGVSEFSSFCIRVAHEVIGCSEKLFQNLRTRPGGILIVGIPASGKTTIVRDLTRVISKEKKVVLVDEKGELAAVYNGIPQNDVGPNTDVLSGFDKCAGIALGVKNLSPQVIVCDEIGMNAEEEAFISAAVNGVEIIATVHGNQQSLKNNHFVRSLVEREVFDTLVFLSCDGFPGKIKNMMDAGDYYDTSSGNRADSLIMSNFRHIQAQPTV